MIIHPAKKRDPDSEGKENRVTFNDLVTLYGKKVLLLAIVVTAGYLVYRFF